MNAREELGISTLPLPKAFHSSSLQDVKVNATLVKANNATKIFFISFFILYG
jgi:hypothetical protein